MVSSAAPDVAAVLLSGPAGGTVGSVPRTGSLPAVARGMAMWPNMALGLGNHVRSVEQLAGHPAAAIAAVNRQVLIDAGRTHPAAVATPPG